MPQAPAGLHWHDEIDIGIVGAGACGLAAAHAASREQLRVVVWERAKVAGGTTALSNGMVPGAGTRMQRALGIFETPDDLYRDIMTRNGGHSDPVLTRRLCEQSAAVVEWLADAHGVDLELVKQVRDPGHTHLRLHAPPTRTGQTLVDGLVQSLHKRAIKLRLGTATQHLWTDADGAVIGAQIKLPKKSPSNVRCAKIILATDGFGADPELLAQHCPEASGLVYAGAPVNTGDALRWAADVGAATQHLGAFHVHAAIAVGSHLLIPWTLMGNGAIIVNQRGQRFTDETGSPTKLVGPVRAQPGHLAYVILDATVLNTVSTEDPHFATHVVPRVVRRANELSGLATQFQIDAGGLARTLEEYNAAAPQGRDTFGRTRFGAPLHPPFYGIRIAPALLGTQGGVAIDAEARVLRADSGPIPNLYAGGGAAVGVSGTGADGYLLGNGLLCALGWGKVAGEHAADAVLSSRSAPTVVPAIEGEPLA